MAMLIGLIAAAALAWMALSSPPQKTLFDNLSDADKQGVRDDRAVGREHQEQDQRRHRRADRERGGLLQGADAAGGPGLPKQAPGGYAILDQLPMGVSRAVEGERLRQARESELARSIEEIDAVAEARVHLATPDASPFIRDKSSPSASVVLKLNAGRSLSESQVQSIVNLVASSVPGMKPEDVTVVDQMGGLLSKKGRGRRERRRSPHRIPAPPGGKVPHPADPAADPAGRRGQLHRRGADRGQSGRNQRDPRTL